ncbi:MAG: hypothetical protein Q4C95_02720 [Planctomycetia bacterium]|nr:hypothetical protein [Planctomycetia bacterium]
MPEINAKQILQETPLQKMFHFETISSTNDWAKKYIQENQQKIKQGNDKDLFPLLVIADQQTAGRGRGNHSWFSPSGALLISILTTWSQLNLSRRESSMLSLRTAVAVQKTIIRFLDTAEKNSVSSLSLSSSQIEPFSNSVRIKMPNDIYIAEKKIAGILIESPNEQAVIIGIGININNSVKQIENDLQTKITSLIDITQTEINFQSFLIALINEIF